MRRILVTGHRGYIGVHLVDLLRQSGHHVTGVDLQLFEGCEWESYVKPHVEHVCDFRALSASDLESYDAIMHLAAISNDPMGDLDPSITYQINCDGTLVFAKKAKKAGVPKFLFASSCSVYGKNASFDIDEKGATAPVTPYAASKIDAESGLYALADESFSPVFLRNATAFGQSPMLRIDLVVNNLLACGLSRGDIRVTSDGSPWRPLIHCKDIARAFIAIMDAPRDVVHNRTINIGANSENYQVREILNQVQKLIPEAKVVYTGEIGADLRNYSVNFDLLYKLLPEFKLSYNLESGMEELFLAYKKYGFSLSDFEGDQFVRLRTLKKRLGKLQ